MALKLAVGGSLTEMTVMVTVASLLSSVPSFAINVKLSDAQLAERKEKWTPREPKITKGYLAKYASMATSADTGAILKW